jgi:hypothetical protein
MVVNEIRKEEVSVVITGTTDIPICNYKTLIMCCIKVETDFCAASTTL